MKKINHDDPVDSNDNSHHLPVPIRQVKNEIASFILTFLILFSFWVLFSGRFDRFHICLGAVSCAGVSYTCRRLIFPYGVSMSIITTWTNFTFYIPWLFKEIFWANLHLLYLTFHPKMNTLINPQIITFKTRLKDDVARTTFANSITLTPGTITIYSGIMGTFAVHCIDDQSGENLPGEMEKRIGAVFHDDE